MHFLEILRFGTFPFEALGVVAWVLIALALVFDFLNGFHDAANSVATVVSTRVLSPQTAVIWAAFFNFVAFLIFPLAVAGTIAADIVDQEMIRDNSVIAATLLAACGWNLLTWYLALPTSSSHALIGGMVGAALVKTWDLGVLKWLGLGKTVLFIVVSPLLGMLFGLGLAVLVAWTFRYVSHRRADRVFRVGQLVSAGWFSLNHGGNDAQKTMGIIFLLLILAGRKMDAAGSWMQAPHVPVEVVLSCHAAIALGTLFGGWRIVKTMGQRIIRLRPVDGFCAETGAGVAVALATTFGGIPVSTTHTITGAIVGVGTLKRVSAVRWGVAGRVVWAWVLTIPGAALMAALSLWLLQALAQVTGWSLG
jgi:PiT family inorganic phosphate transporter